MPQAKSDVELRQKIEPLGTQVLVVEQVPQRPVIAGIERIVVHVTRRDDD